MREPLRNPYAQPFYYSVALAYLGIALLALAVHDYSSRHDLDTESAIVGGCGTGSYSAGVTYPPELDRLAKEGAVLFRNQCASCHNKNMRDNLTGPALGGVRERWASYPAEDLHAWIRNSQAMVAQGHPRAAELWVEWGPTVMTGFPALTDEEIEGLLLYIEGQYMFRPIVVP